MECLNYSILINLITFNEIKKKKSKMIYFDFKQKSRRLDVVFYEFIDNFNCYVALRKLLKTPIKFVEGFENNSLLSVLPWFSRNCKATHCVRVIGSVGKLVLLFEITSCYFRPRENVNKL